MSALNSADTASKADADHPYPSWDAVAESVGVRRGIEAIDHQARKEARIWRELAEEPRQDETSPGLSLR